MYKGFNLILPEEKIEIEYYKLIGLEILKDYKIITETTLNKFINPDESIDASKLQNNWFPQMKGYNVFISHSHRDHDLALALAGWLWRHFRIKSFIDSAIWGYSNDLLRIIDEKETKYYSKKHETYLHDYSLRNESTAHVHMMLTTALTMMMDSTECIIFLNSANSIKQFEGKLKTNSPWIYYEMTTSKRLRVNLPDRYENKRIEKSIPLMGDVITENRKFSEMVYNTELNHLKEINATTLLEWLSVAESSDDEDSLDILYNLTDTFPIHKLS